MALTEAEAHAVAVAAREADEALRASARAQAGPGAVQIADGVFRAREGGPAYQVMGGAVVGLTARQADDLITARGKGSVALELDAEGNALAGQAARLRGLKPLVDVPLAARLESEAVALDGVVASHAALITQLGGVPATRTDGAGRSTR